MRRPEMDLLRNAMNLMCLAAVAMLIGACANIDGDTEAAKLESAAKIYKECLVDGLLTKKPDIDLWCRSSRIRLYQAIMSDPRSYDKNAFFDTYAKNVVEMAKDDAELEKSRTTR